MSDFWARFRRTDPDEISTDEVLRAGEAQLQSSRAVLNLMDDALRKGADIVAPPHSSDAEEEILLVDESHPSGDRTSPQGSRRL